MTVEQACLICGVTRHWLDDQIRWGWVECHQGDIPDDQMTVLYGLLTAPDRTQWEITKRRDAERLKKWRAEREERLARNPEPQPKPERKPKPQSVPLPDIVRLPDLAAHFGVGRKLMTQWIRQGKVAKPAAKILTSAEVDAFLNFARNRRRRRK